MAFLTLLTQVGGLIWIISILISRLVPVRHFSGLRLLIFTGLYACSAIWIVPPLARSFGRVPLPVFTQPYLKPESLWFAFLNRHYVRPELKKALEEVAQSMQSRYPGTTVNYLDANFPFIDGYPLEPHLSHRDGKKVDLSFYWTEISTNRPVRGSPSPLGYGACAAPLPGEPDQAAACEAKGFWYISLTRTLPAPFFSQKNYRFDAERTRELLRLLAEHPVLGKLLLEPHLKTRLGLESFGKIRWQGCHAARHDDHVHVQL
jgi:hypothetical protein